jgi:hypothetical protein
MRRRRIRAGITGVVTTRGGCTQGRGSGLLQKMGRVIRAQRRGAAGGVKGRTATTCRHGPAQLRKLDYAEREG